MFARPNLSFLALGLALLIHGPSQAQEATKPAAPSATTAPKATAPKATGDKASNVSSEKASSKPAPDKPTSKPTPAKPDTPNKPAAKDGKPAGNDKTVSKDAKPASPAKPPDKDGKPASPDKPQVNVGKPGAADKGTGKDGKPVVAKRVPVGPAVSKKNALALLPLQATDWKPGCGCRFFKPTDQKEHGPLLLRLDDKKRAAIRAEGNLEQLKLVDERHVQRKPPAIMAHDRMMLKFKGSSTTASFSGSAERNCAKFQDSCKSATYQGVLSLNQQGKQSSFPVWGVCGCQ